MNINLLGSTGSIGTQTLDVVRQHKDEFNIQSLAAYGNGDLLIEQALEFKPKIVSVGKEELYAKVRNALPGNIEVISGENGAKEIASMKADMTVCSIVGMAGLDSFLISLKHSNRVGLANKESLVCGGELIKGNTTPIIPIDSEHSAIFQCLAGNKKNEVKKIILTASGGPFRNTPKEEFKDITVEKALKHPNWTMGRKITIDSATLMNKGLEVIEAVRLFGIDNIDVLVHPQSVIHSMVEYVDGSCLAQLGNADMRVPIQYALTYPSRLDNKSITPLDLSLVGRLDFEKPNRDKFPCLDLAFNALNKGGLALTALNSANEIAVELFLNRQIGFLDIPRLIEHNLNDFENTVSGNELSLENIHFLHNETIDRIRKDYKNILR